MRFWRELKTLKVNVSKNQTKSGKIAATVKNRFGSFFVCSKPKVCNVMK